MHNILGDGEFSVAFSVRQIFYGLIQDRSSLSFTLSLSLSLFPYTHLFVQCVHTPRKNEGFFCTSNAHHVHTQAHSLTHSHIPYQSISYEILCVLFFSHCHLFCFFGIFIFVAASFFRVCVCVRRAHGFQSEICHCFMSCIFDWLYASTRCTFLFLQPFQKLVDYFCVLKYKISHEERTTNTQTHN